MSEQRFYFYPSFIPKCWDITYLDACFEGSFTSQEVDAKWDLLETIQSNIEDRDCDKGK
jgi:hypothetical protein